ncbi:threonine ammonia-lyase [Nautilia sp. PV-1]|uniref:threonine ammonia-lyase n=1 Tax=Nautilia sp. PV-1 TaxID=2579250 RepID=UPI000FD8517F|nr:threonine ammonia-lyase [Nautilia sp. PV-1]AZV46764.1 threonine ammonia-lyase [Nautilia sp. PV-1]
MIPFEEIKQAHKRIKKVVYKTPFAYAPILSQKVGNEIYLKKENLQITGAFKLRGAFNKIASIPEEKRKKGVIAASAGNHAQGVAFSANYFNVPAIIVMPEATPLTKVTGVKEFGGEVVLAGNNYDEAYEYAVKLAEKKGFEFIHPFADDKVIAGQGTIGIEMLEQVPELDYIIVPIGGGGLISGIASAVKQINPHIKVIGVTAEGAPAMRLSFLSGSVQDTTFVKTIADGIAVRDTNPKMFKLVKEVVDDIVEVDDEEIANAILFLMERQKVVVEGAGAVGVAALLHHKIKFTAPKKVGVVLSGGNIDVTMINLIIEKGLLKSHRKMKLIIRLVDKPGALQRLTEILAAEKANIVQIGYDRTDLNLAIGDANVTIALETRGLEHQEAIKRALHKNGYKFVVE